ncbi:7-carboxy-7-deazaguanine synthase QueE [Mesobacillus foraminis]|uniref:7-carboxy-7-deazaguanine synthase n=1 Tax=Mesobacillus foraminis TaxID=279826 RepID=A0A4R2BJS0_9BACI|nr:7-carboxy-7-deazaguanine synthase QueE [Mesobacillus foraminis]TCN27447.1 7-carboxy-7-deazaguanine synthase [Mesobacillus foraminis]
MSKIPVMEIFGPTIQGEGMVIGQKTMFVRTAGCDYSCSWCDSAFTWDGSGKHLIRQMEPEEIWKQLQELGGVGFSHVTISGGNPALLKNMDGLVELLKGNGIKLCLETQGSKWQDWMMEIDELTISPKPPSSGMITNYEALDGIIERLSTPSFKGNVSIKVVIFNDDDFEYARNIHKRYPHLPFFMQVGNEDTVTMDRSELVSCLLAQYESLIEKVIADPELKEVKVLPQLHALVWGNKRGV